MPVNIWVHSQMGERSIHSKKKKRLLLASTPEGADKEQKFLLASTPERIYVLRIYKESKLVNRIRGMDGF